MAAAPPPPKRSRIDETAKEQGSVILKIGEGYSQNASKFKLLEATPDIRNTLAQGDRFIFMFKFIKLII
jgi:hypothetical protein